MSRRFSLLCLAALASCTLDPSAVVEQADLSVEVNGARELGATRLKVEATGPSGRTVTKETARISEPTVLVFEKGSLGEGQVSLVFSAYDGDQVRGCDGFTVAIAPGARVSRTLLDTAISPAHCGACFNRCEAPQASRACLAGACGPLVCAAGFADLDGRIDNGCEAPTGCLPEPEDTEAACTDGRDNDCDNKTDCDDPDCNGLTRSCAAGSCTGTQTFNCASKSWSACAVDPHGENSPELCSDGIDNDCDGRTDCQDPDCLQLQLFCNPPGTQCIGVQVWECLTGLISTCRLAHQGPESDPRTCSDGIDNDCDGKVDCADLGCLGQKCNPGSPCCVQGLCTACR